MKTFSLLISLAVFSLLAMGCTPSAEKKSSGTNVDLKAADKKDDAHNHVAPHGGQLIELGRNHEYHAELLEDHQTESITVHVLDGDMKELAIKQSSVSLILTAGENTQTFELAAKQTGSSSEFSSNDEKMMEMFETKDSKGKLRVTINDKPFTSSFVHSHDEDHDEDDHGHAHD